MQEYKATFNLASAAGQLVTTIDKMNPARSADPGIGSGLIYRPAVSPQRSLTAVNVTFSSAATQTIDISIIDQSGQARVIQEFAVTAATSGYFEPEHPITIGPTENFQIDVTATANPSITGTITVFTEEK